MMFVADQSHHFWDGEPVLWIWSYLSLSLKKKVPDGYYYLGHYKASEFRYDDTWCLCDKGLACVFGVEGNSFGKYSPESKLIFDKSNNMK